MPKKIRTPKEIIDSDKKSLGELKDENANLVISLKELILNEKMAFLARFSTGIAHHIKDPLTNISSSAQICSHNFKLDDNMDRHLKMIIKNTDKVNNLIVLLLNNTKLGRLSLSRCNIQMVLDCVSSLVKDRCKEKSIVLLKRYARNLSPIIMDESLLIEAFYNILTNSLDAMNDGGTLTISADSENSGIVVNIEDSGSGISRNDVDKVFEPFYSTKNRSIGLGLFLTYQIIDSHKGKIEIESNPGNGTIVTVRLPGSKESAD